MQSEDWFKTWFDTEYYHLLYKDRNDAEADVFIKHLFHSLNLKKEATVLDLACGKGRHSLVINELGFNVTGVDLSENSIKEASKCENEKLSFAVNDMRMPLEGQNFDVVVNLFTSFGYFNSNSENQQVIDSVHSMLNPDGLFVIDFMNVKKALQNLVAFEEKSVEGVVFSIERKFENNHIQKTIRFKHNEQSFVFTERVQALQLSDFEKLFDSKFRIVNLFGNYTLDPFDAVNSDRLIILVQKN